MSIRLLFYAGIREALGRPAESLALPPGVNTLAKLRDHLSARGEPWLALSSTRSLRFAINQAMAGADAPIAAGDEIAVFPPLSGG